MSSRGKKKTTMAKLSRESRLRERRVEKAARKNARKEAAANGTTEWPDHVPDDLEADGEEFAQVATSPDTAGEADS
ncbi:MAG TPA: hypothetical protein VII87_14835 [Solirubrobacteraceae bacterium]|jgi:hypothetical protein